MGGGACGAGGDAVTFKVAGSVSWQVSGKRRRPEQRTRDNRGFQDGYGGNNACPDINPEFKDDAVWSPPVAKTVIESCQPEDFPGGRDEHGHDDQTDREGARQARTELTNKNPSPI